MGMRLRLREYKAHPVEDPKEREIRWNRAKVILAAILGIVAPIVVVGSLVANGPPIRFRAADKLELERKLKLERLAAAQATSEYIVPSTYPEFFYHNWGHLSTGGHATAQGREAQDREPNPSVPEEYEELRGLAVYEVPKGAPEPTSRAGSSGDIPPATRGALEAAEKARTGKTADLSNYGGGQ